MNGTAIQTRQEVRPLKANNLMQLDPLTVAQHFVRSGFFTDAKDESKAVVKILFGAEFGIPPVASMLNIHVIQGKPTMGAHMIGAVLRKAGYDFRAAVTTNTECKIVYSRGGEVLGESVFTWEDATRAQLTGKDNWRHFPKAMLFARAMSQGARMHAPDAFMGSIYTPDELGAEVELDNEGNIANVVVMDVTPPQEAPAQREPENDLGMSAAFEEAWNILKDNGYTNPQLMAQCRAALGGAFSKFGALNLTDKRMVVNHLNEMVVQLDSPTDPPEGDEITPEELDV